MARNLTLFDKIVSIERMDSELKAIDRSVILDTISLQKKLFEQYKSNRILQQAITREKSIEQTLMELAEVNKGDKKVLPRKKDLRHNAKVIELGELITEPHQLKCFGYFTPDNFITTGGYIMGGIFAISNLMQYVIAPSVVSPQTVEELKFVNQVIMPLVVSGITVPILGSLTNYHRFKDLPVTQAQYLDMKIKSHYH